MYLIINSRFGSKLLAAPLPRLYVSKLKLKLIRLHLARGSRKPRLQGLPSIGVVVCRCRCRSTCRWRRRGNHEDMGHMRQHAGQLAHRNASCIIIKRMRRWRLRRVRVVVAPVWCWCRQCSRLPGAVGGLLGNIIVIDARRNRLLRTHLTDQLRVELRLVRREIRFAPTIVHVIHASIHAGAIIVLLCGTHRWQGGRHGRRRQRTAQVHAQAIEQVGRKLR